MGYDKRFYSIIQDNCANHIKCTCKCHDPNSLMLHSNSCCETCSKCKEEKVSNPTLIRLKSDKIVKNQLKKLLKRAGVDSVDDWFTFQNEL